MDVLRRLKASWDVLERPRTFRGKPSRTKLSSRFQVGYQAIELSQLWVIALLR